MDIRKELFSFKDEEYKKFSSSLIPTLSPEKVIGIRTPVLRKFARKIKGNDEAKAFLKSLPHKYFEENNLHAFLISEIKDFDECVYETDRFLPFVDNWATSDSFNPKALSKEPEKLLELAIKWIGSKETYTIRFGILTLMRCFLDDRFEERFLEIVSDVKSSEYYVNMMIAWYFATALAKQWDSAVPYLIEKRLDEWVHNKTISKACESFRITAEQKQFLKTLKIKKER